MKVGVFGAAGRMGQAVMQAIWEDKKTELGELYQRSNDDNNDLNKFCANSDIIIDFSSAAGLRTLLNECLKNKKPLVTGTTGLSDDDLNALSIASNEIPIIYAPNTSLGANLLAWLSEKAAKILDNSYEVDINELHHRLKKDAPSGTALMIGHKIAKARGDSFEKVKKLNRVISGGVAEPGEISFSAMRGGKNNCEHDVYFIGDYDILKITHRASNRIIFAKGALKAAKWLINKPAGFYNMFDVLELS